MEARARVGIRKRRIAWQGFRRLDTATGDLIPFARKKPGTMCACRPAPWNALSDLDIAAVVTYERNAWGQNSGDVVQPADVKNLR